MRNFRNRFSKLTAMYQQKTGIVKRYCIADLMEYHSGGLSEEEFAATGIHNALHGKGHTEAEWAIYLPEMVELGKQLTGKKHENN